MRSRSLLATVVAAALLPLGALAAPASATPMTAPTPVREIRMTTTGVCPPGTVRIPRASAVEEYRRAHRLATRQHLSRAQHRRLVLCVTVPVAGTPTPVPAATPAPAPTPTPEAAPSAPADWQVDMLARINALRASVGIAPVAACAPITRAAQDYADAMARTGSFAHVGVDGTQPWDRMRAAGYRWLRASENIARGYADPASVMGGWIASPGHYANLVDGEVRHVGLGLAVDAAGTRWWVQDFGAGGSC